MPTSPRRRVDSRYGHAARRGLPGGPGFLFVREDCETLPLGQLAAPALAVLASDDRVDTYLLGRYLAAGLDADRQRLPGQSPDRRALAAVLHALQVHLADPKAAEKRKRAEPRISAAQVLGGQVRLKRLRLDGSMDTDRTELRRRIAF